MYCILQSIEKNVNVVQMDKTQTMNAFKLDGLHFR